MIKDQDFYNKESAYYSPKRYPEQASNYVQFFFKRRLEVTIGMLKGAEVVSIDSNRRLLEIGCADGVVMRAIAKEMEGSFSSMVGIDTAPEMIDTAEVLTPDQRLKFFERGQEPAAEKFDAIVEIGVANYADAVVELAYISAHLAEGGVCVLSIAGTGSLNSRVSGGEGYRHFLSYGEYEKKIRKLFTIDRVTPVGLRLPLLWHLPILARIIQPFLEVCLAPFAPGLFHEKVYLLKKKIR